MCRRLCFRCVSLFFFLSFSLDLRIPRRRLIEYKQLPFNHWPKDPKLKSLGRYQQLLMFEGIPSYSLRLYTNVLNWPKEEVEALLSEVQKILKDRSCHLYTLVHFVYGQKPVDAVD